MDMNYYKKIKEHMSAYKKEKFPTLTGMSFFGRREGNILPSICGNLNLLETYRNEFLENDLSNIHFQSYFHSLDYPQAMCINFFFPLIMEEKLEIILQTLGFDDEKVKFVTFEKVSDIDNKPGQRATKFDFYFETVSNKKFYFDIKYAFEFFGFPKNKELRNKYELFYEKAAEPILKKEWNTCENFLDNYHIMRNLIEISDDSYIVFAVPEKNEKAYKQAKEAEDMVIEKYKNNVKVLTWDKLYDVVEEQNFTGKLKTHFDEFKKKYKL